ncbi:MAG: hypothetical protein ROR55_20030 [Devosia sp.]
MAVTLAFYRGRGTVLDRVVRAITRSRFSHVEVVIQIHPDGSWTMIGSSPRDGGVRAVTIQPKPRHWELVDAPGDAQEAEAFARSKIGAKYDFFAILFTFVIPIRRQNPRKWLCTELVAHAVGAPFLAHLSPGDLAEILPRLSGAR